MCKDIIIQNNSIFTVPLLRDFSPQLMEFYCWKYV